MALPRRIYKVLVIERGDLILMFRSRHTIGAQLVKRIQNPDDVSHILFP